ncbi:methylenetetrahydrofolate dehydrogenase (NAD(+)) [Malassezia yamatoensis]|uniref:Methylenetetrahydrofolate dehydrogenase (NAD(+)) n=1 Tax=Malassezia yamatoensis TaxID=253288 RepID=A0AAJ5YYL5_9BASI|nr:methylenetetrahydrofolate dehydrogenase (NAD(+)) [Malassezia yamatoensis]
MAAANKTDYPGRLLQATAIAKPFQDSIEAEVRKRKEANLSVPKLVGILAKPNPPSIAYAEWTRKACTAVGINFEIWKTWDDADEASNAEQATDQKKSDSLQNFGLEADVEDLILAANRDESIDGVMIYYPIFGGRQDTYLQQIVDPRKDVEGLNFYYCWNLYHNVRWIKPSHLGNAPGTTSESELLNDPKVAEKGQAPEGYAKSILPCTPLAVVKALESVGVYDLKLPYGNRLYGKTVTVINRSEVVGRPLAALLANDGARVFSVDIDSIIEFDKRVEQGSPQNTGLAKSERVRKAHEENTKASLRSSHVVRASKHSDVESCVRESDVVVGGVPSASYKVPTSWIKEGAVCINFSSEKNFESDVRSRASAYLPIIGKITVAMLQRNLLRLVEYKAIAQGQK